MIVEQLGEFDQASDVLMRDVPDMYRSSGRVINMLTGIITDVADSEEMVKNDSYVVVKIPKFLWDDLNTFRSIP